MPADVEGWLGLARARLSPERTGVVLDDAVLVPTPTEIGALAGFAAVARDGDLRVSAYVFDEWTAGAAKMEDLKAQAVAEGREPLAIVSGCILYFATSGPASRDRAALFDLSSSFSAPP